MLREDIIYKILSIMDELGFEDELTDTSRYPIDAIIDQCGTEVLLNAPQPLLGIGFDFSNASQIINSDGTGLITLPEGFIRLIEFKMSEWLRPVFNASIGGSKTHIKQSYKATRGGITKPIVIIYNNTLEYFSVSNKNSHDIETARCVLKQKVGEHFPEPLIDMLSWLTASKTLSIMNEPDAASNARAEYEALLHNSFKMYN